MTTVLWTQFTWTAVVSSCLPLNPKCEFGNRSILSFQSISTFSNSLVLFSRHIKVDRSALFAVVFCNDRQLWTSEQGLLLIYFSYNKTYIRLGFYIYYYEKIYAINVRYLWCWRQMKKIIYIYIYTSIHFVYNDRKYNSWTYIYIFNLETRFKWTKRCCYNMKLYCWGFMCDE